MIHIKPNRSDRFRRALIAHCIEAEPREVARWYHPVLRMDGTVGDLGKAPAAAAAASGSSSTGDA